LIFVLTFFTRSSFCQQGDSLIKVTSQLNMITGNGKLANTDDLREQARYISDLRIEIKLLIEQQKTLEEIQKLI